MTPLIVLMLLQFKRKQLRFYRMKRVMFKALERRLNLRKNFQLLNVSK